MDLFFSDAYLYAGTPLETTNKAKWVADSLVERPIDDVRIVEPTLAVTAEMLERVHDPDYVRAICTGDPSQLANRNGVCTWTPEFGRSRLASTGGVVQAALQARHTGGVTGSMSSGLHHARLDHGAGYCTLNGLAIAAAELVHRGAQRILIVDFDAHGGGGTASLIASHPRIEQIDVAVDHFDSHISTSRSRYWFSSGPDYLQTVQTALGSAQNPGEIDLVLYNAGVDPHEDCPTGGSRGVTDAVLRSRDATVFDWAAAHGVPATFVLAGGYVGGRMTRDHLVDLHRQTIETAARSTEARSLNCSVTPCG